MRQFATLLVLALMAGVSWGAEAAQQDTSLAEQAMADFDRNIALGAVLEVRPGTRTELDQLRLLADRGLERARDMVAQGPESAEAHYLLASWLLYGYTVVEVEKITFDSQGGARSEVVSQVVQGLADDPEEGLQALRKAAELAPESGDYLLDLAAALFDFGQAFEAQGILKGIWAGEPELDSEHKMQAALLLSSIAETEGDIPDAREWIYAALSLDPVVAPAIEHLRRLDAAEAAAAEEATAAAVEQALQQAYAEQYEDVEPEYYDEESYDEHQMEYDEAYEEE
jgi:hypothetical protein